MKKLDHQIGIFQALVFIGFIKTIDTNHVAPPGEEIAGFNPFPAIGRALAKRPIRQRN